MKREEDQELWDLLGKAAEPRISPFFARNVVRTVRQKQASREGFFGWFGLKQLVPATAVAVVITAATLYFRTPENMPVTAEVTPEPVVEVDAQDYEVVADLDDLIAFEENNLWAAESSSL